MWGSGQSTSKSEAAAAANSGIPTADLPVSYTIPKDLLSAWKASACRPGISLVGADLRPELMVNNVRAAVFPHLQQQVQSSIALSMSRQAWADVEALERTHSWKCGDVRPKLRAVQPVWENGHEPRKEEGLAQKLAEETVSTAAPSKQRAMALPPVSSFEAALGRIWSGHWAAGSGEALTGKVAKPPAVVKPAAADSSETPMDDPFASFNPSSSSSSSSSSSAPASFVTSSARPVERFLSSERWLVQRCDGQQLYRVQYFGSGDAFHAQVVPTNVSGLAATAWVAFKQAAQP